MKHTLELTKREISEIHLALIYSMDFNHGTSGHLGYTTLAALAWEIGFFIQEDGSLFAPDTVVVTDLEEEKA